MLRPFLAALVLGMGVTTASALEIHDAGVPSLRSGTGQLVIGGIVGRGLSDPQARKCYGSTLCSESGTYYTDRGVLQYHNGQPLPPIKRPSGAKTGGVSN